MAVLSAVLTLCFSKSKDQPALPVTVISLSMIHMLSLLIHEFPKMKMTLKEKKKKHLKKTLYHREPTIITTTT